MVICAIFVAEILSFLKDENELCLGKPQFGTFRAWNHMELNWVQQTLLVFYCFRSWCKFGTGIGIL